MANVLVGEFDFLTKPVSALVRLATPTQLGDFTEVPLPTRFIFLMLGPKVTPTMNIFPKKKIEFNIEKMARVMANL